MWSRVRGAAGLGRAITTARNEAGLTQAELADLIGADRTTVLNMEQGRNQALGRLVAALSVLGHELIVVPRGSRVTVEETGSNGEG